MYEYMSETIQMRPGQGRGPDAPGDLGTRLTELSAEGWELVEVISNSPRPMVTILLRRSVEAPK